MHSYVWTVEARRDINQPSPTFRTFCFLGPRKSDDPGGPNAGGIAVCPPRCDAIYDIKRSSVLPPRLLSINLQLVDLFFPCHGYSLGLCCTVREEMSERDVIESQTRQRSAIHYRLVSRVTHRSNFSSSSVLMGESSTFLRAIYERGRFQLRALQLRLLVAQ